MLSCSPSNLAKAQKMHTWSWDLRPEEDMMEFLLWYIGGAQDAAWAFSTTIFDFIDFFWSPPTSTSHAEPVMHPCACGERVLPASLLAPSLRKTRVFVSRRLRGRSTASLLPARSFVIRSPIGIHLCGGCHSRQCVLRPRCFCQSARVERSQPCAWDIPRALRLPRARKRGNRKQDDPSCCHRGLAAHAQHACHG